MLAQNEGEETASLNGTLICPAVCCYFVLLVLTTESLIKLCASILGRSRIFFRQ